MFAVPKPPDEWQDRVCPNFTFDRRWTYMDLKCPQKENESKKLKLHHILSTLGWLYFQLGQNMDISGFVLHVMGCTS